jgi:large subunit ribosomal protein L17
MRHRKKFNHLGRKSAHRQETLSSMATALIINKRINTTLAKAKALRVYVEPLITKSKVDSTHSRRVVFSYLGDKNAVSELFRDVAQKVADRPGGYTRILKTGFRKGDAAEMCFIELVDYNANMLRSEEETQQKRTRRSRRGKKSGDAPKVAAPKAEAVEPEAAEAPKAEAVEPEAVEAPKTEAVEPEAVEAPKTEAVEPEAVEAPKPEEAPEKEPKAEVAPEKEPKSEETPEKETKAEESPEKKSETGEAPEKKDEK